MPCSSRTPTGTTWTTARCGCSGPGVPMVVPTGMGARLRRRGFRQVDELRPARRPPGRRLRIEATEAAHRGFAPPIGPTDLAIGFLLEAAGTVYFPGDTALFDGMAELARDLDLALMPVWGWGPRAQAQRAPRPAGCGAGAAAAAAPGRGAHPLGHAPPGRASVAASRRRGWTRPTRSRGWPRSWRRRRRCTCCRSAVSLSLPHVGPRRCRSAVGDLDAAPPPSARTKAATRSSASSSTGVRRVAQARPGDQLGVRQQLRDRVPQQVDARERVGLARQQQHRAADAPASGRSAPPSRASRADAAGS